MSAAIWTRLRGGFFFARLARPRRRPASCAARERTEDAPKTHRRCTEDAPKTHRRCTEDAPIACPASPAEGCPAGRAR
ncbi:hypothetical protein EYA88_17960 [Burkholderia pseudomallei]|nr:hypothetical protein EYA88_17960 [Burkholderia pseudomallei]